MSATWYAASPPASPISRTRSWSRSSRRATAKIFAPSRASDSANARPSPDDAPVMRTTRSLRLRLIGDNLSGPCRAGSYFRSAFPYHPPSMDTVTHSLAGAMLGRNASDRTAARAAMIVGAVGAFVPDLDFLLIHTRIDYLKDHRS